MTDWVVELMEKLGAPGAGLAIALENLFPPIPSELILPLAGFTASQGDMNVVAVLVCTTLGSVLGALALYWVGALLGRERTLALAAKLPLVKLDDITKTEAWFLKHGRKTVFFGRMIPIFRSMISIPAGVERMPIGVFTLLTATGSLIWNTIFVMAGYTLGENWELVEKYVGMGSKAVLAIVLVAVLVFVGIRLNEKYRGRSGDEDGDQGDRPQPGRPGQGGQGHPGQNHPGQPYQGQAQPHPGQPAPQGRPYQGRHSQDRPHQVQPHQVQPYQGRPPQPQPQPYQPQPQPHQPQPYPGQGGQPYQGRPPQAQTRRDRPYQDGPGQGGQGHQGWNPPRT
ncbi:DedA family protein [Actinocorallia populi]|uniref:DedA family protein n=1 Tax=Actinocorallia populi TaxID=2079200 RepID=UPI00130059A5